jgi:hypothetical protein
MSLNPQTIALLKRRLEEAERNIQLIRQLLQDETGDDGGASPLSAPTPVRRAGAEGMEASVIQGAFDGEHMKGEDGQLYPVPANYASKSKLVEGDRLKLTIETDGAFVYKQIGPAERKRVRGVFGADDQGRYVVRTEDKEYRILLASVTFYHIEPGDEVTILLPTEGEAVWGAVENVLKADEPAENPSDAPAESAP